MAFAVFAHGRVRAVFVGGKTKVGLRCVSRKRMMARVGASVARIRIGWSVSVDRRR